MVKISPSILSADFGVLAEQVATVERAGADWIHVDVMDGHFVPNITIGPLIVEALKKRTKLPLDTHLMIEKPERYIDAFATAGSDILVVHAETCPHLHRTIQHIKSEGMKAGVSLNPSTDPSVIQYVLNELDLVLVMSVNPGFGGQKFIPSAPQKIRTIREMAEKEGADIEIEVDGGVNKETAPLVAKEGATVLVAGSAIFKSDDVAAALKAIRDAADGV